MLCQSCSYRYRILWCVGRCDGRKSVRERVRVCVRLCQQPYTTIEVVMVNRHQPYCMALLVPF
eukprot:m.44898 g.44898  ORF g.44898 m.44898 type:complete len:63 (-) comp6584_c0_seq2:144-332(-)